MESVIKLPDELFKRLEVVSIERDVDVDTLASQYLDTALFHDEESLLFEKSTHEALLEVESRPPRNLTKEEFLKELESW